MAGKASNATSSSLTRSAATRVSPGAAARTARAAAGVSREPERGFEAYRAEHPQRIVGQDTGTGRAQATGAEVGPAARGIHDAGPAGRQQGAEGHAERVDGEVAGGQITGEIGGAEVVEVELQAGPGHPGRAALGVEHDRGGAEGRRHPLGQRQGTGR